MSGSARTTAERLGAFASRALEQGCSVELHHQSRGLVARIDKGDAALSGTDIELMAADHAAALHGRQGYELRAVYPEGNTKQSLIFRVAGEASEADGLSEPTTERGALATLQKQNERLLQALERKDKPLVDAFETLGKMLAQYQQQQADMFKAQLEIASMTLEREEAKADRELSRRKWDATMQRFGPFADAILAKWLPGSVKRDDKLHEFAASLDEAQQKAILAVLDSEQMALMHARKWGELMASVIDKGQIEALLPLLRPEQIAMLDALAGVAPDKQNGAPRAQGS